MHLVRDKHEIKVGCCGFAAAQKTYFERFKVIEIQQTFYQLPEIKTAEKWRSAAPPGFEFTMKAWQLITHVPSSPTYRRLRERIDPSKADRYGSFRGTMEVMDAWKRTAEFAKTLGASLIVFQCPASFKPLAQNVKNMETFFNKIDRAGFTFAWEPRGAWPHDVIMRLCEELELIHSPSPGYSAACCREEWRGDRAVARESEGGWGFGAIPLQRYHAACCGELHCVDPFKNEPLFGRLDYFRLHGINDYVYTYTDKELEVLRKKISEKPTYVMFNNNTMKEDALRFLEIIRS